MDERDAAIMLGYLEQLTKAVEKIADQLELANLPDIITCDNSPLDFKNIDVTSIYDICKKWDKAGMPTNREVNV